MSDDTAVSPESAAILATVPELDPPRPYRPSFALADAMLCVACEQVYEAHKDGCPSCGSAVRFAIDRVISRREKGKGKR